MIVVQAFGKKKRVRKERKKKTGTWAVQNRN